MGQVQKPAQNEKEQPLFNKAFRDFKGIFTQASRVACPENNFYDLLNLIPIGPANVHTVPDITGPVAGNASFFVYWMQYANINTTDYLIMFDTGGVVWAYNIAADTVTAIQGGSFLSGAGSRMDQYNTDAILIIDSTGYYTWNGTTFTGPISGGILPTPPYSGVDIAVFSNYVWLLNKRLLYISTLPGVNGGTGYDTLSWTVAGGALVQRIVDPQLRGFPTRIFSANGYLYIFGKSSITVISGVYIPSTASPPAPSFTITNIQALIGTDQPASVVPYDRSLLFANKYGLWSLTGTTCERLSKDIDGTIQYIDLTKTICGGQCQVLNQQQASFLLNQLNDPVFGTRNIVANFFDGKWWFANYPNTGTITFMCWGIYKDNPTLFAIIGNKLYRLFDNISSSPPASWQTPLWPMEDPLANKEIQRAGFEIESASPSSTINVNMDNQSGSYPFNASSQIGVITFLNSSSQTIQFVNHLNQPIFFTASQFELFVGDSEGSYGNYVGMSGASTQGSVFELSGIYMDYYIRNRWT